MNPIWVKMKMICRFHTAVFQERSSTAIKSRIWQSLFVNPVWVKMKMICRFHTAVFQERSSTSIKSRIWQSLVWESCLSQDENYLKIQWNQNIRKVSYLTVCERILIISRGLSIELLHDTIDSRFITILSFSSRAEGDALTFA